MFVLIHKSKNKLFVSYVCITSVSLVHVKQ